MKLEFDGKDINQVAMEYGKFYLERGERFNTNSQENLDFQNWVNPILDFINEELMFPTEGMTGSAAWWYDLFNFLEEPAPKEIKEYFDWAWADMVKADIVFIES